MADGALTNAVISLLNKNFQEAHQRFLAKTNDAEAGWRFSCACFDLADFATVDAQRAQFANQGIAAARQALAQNSNSSPAHYYLGMNIGQLAETKRGLSALGMVKEMEREFLAARALDERLDRAGPDRNLGLLYRDAPSIISVGSRAKARQHLQKAVELAPDLPENQLNLIESYLKWSDRTEAIRQLREFEKLWPNAPKQFAGNEWALALQDWDSRLNSAKKKLEEASKVTEPRHPAP